MDRITTRQALPEDWQILQKLNDEIFKINLQFDQHINPNWEYTKAGITYFKNLCKPHKTHTLIAYSGDVPVGYANSYIRQVNYYHDGHQTVAELENIGVIPSYQKKGIAQMLLAQIILWAKSQNARYISAECYSQNTSALHFYNTLGFKQTDCIMRKNI